MLLILKLAFYGDSFAFLPSVKLASRRLNENVLLVKVGVTALHLLTVIGELMFRNGR